MQSDVITVSETDIAPALDLVERTATYIGYPEAFGARMRLLAEELLHSARPVLGDTVATLWVNPDADNMEIHLRLTGMLSDATRDQLVEISKSRCNEPPKGLFSRIGAFFADAFMSEESGYVPLFMDGTESTGAYTMPLSLLTGYNAAAPETPKDDMRAVELSILQGMADDVTVCARPSHAELVVVKRLPGKG